MEDQRTDSTQSSANQPANVTPISAPPESASESDLRTVPKRLRSPLGDASEATPNPPRHFTQAQTKTPLGPKLQVGREFGIHLLYIMAGTLAAMIAVIALTEYWRASQMQAALLQVFHVAGLPVDPGETKAPGVTPDTLRAATELLKQVREAQQEQRSFWTDIAQKILLNLLLPLLTAMFGYVFGRDQGEREERARDQMEAGDRRG